jgi:hypothetical protein
MNKKLLSLLFFVAITLLQNTHNHAWAQRLVFRQDTTQKEQKIYLPKVEGVYQDTTIFYTSAYGAQIAYERLLAQKTIKEATYVFEGVFVKNSNKSYYAMNATSEDARKIIFTSYLIKIKHVYKGDLKIGTVEFIDYGGRVGNDYNDYHSYHGIGDSENSAIFFCNLNNLPDTIAQKADNTVTCCYSNLLFTGFESDGIGWNSSYMRMFKNNNELDSFMNSIKGIKAKKHNNSQGSITPPTETPQKKSVVTITTNFTGIVKRAGNNEVLTINGSGFGNTKGIVKFRYADSVEVKPTKIFIILM